VPGYFLDTSALAKLYHPEIGSERMESLVQAPGTRLIVSQLSPIEIQPAARRIQEPHIRGHFIVALTVKEI
jgi:hypothetical protein